MAKKNTANKKPTEAESNIPEDKFHLKVYAPFKTYYEGVVASISAENGTGPFDILAQHHNFLTLLSPCDLKIMPEQDSKEPEEIKITRGIMQVKANDVVVFLDV